MRTIVLSEEHTRLEIPTDLTALQEIELRALAVEIDERVTSIWDQLGEWNHGTLPDHMMTEEWRKKAQAAGSYFKSKLARVRLEMARRQDANKRAKAERIAAAQAYDEGDHRKAFIEAAKQALSREVYLSIWELARQTNPEAFSGTET